MKKSKTTPGYMFAPSMLSSPWIWMKIPWLYVKWGKPKIFPKYRPYGKNGIWFQLPDRELIICAESERPLDIMWMKL